MTECFRIIRHDTQHPLLFLNSIYDKYMFFLFITSQFPESISKAFHILPIGLYCPCRSEGMVGLLVVLQLVVSPVKT